MYLHRKKWMILIFCVLNIVSMNLYAQEDGEMGDFGDQPFEEPFEPPPIEEGLKGDDSNPVPPPLPMDNDESSSRSNNDFRSGFNSGSGYSSFSKSSTLKSNGSGDSNSKLKLKLVNPNNPRYGGQKSN